MAWATVWPFAQKGVEAIASVQLLVHFFRMGTLTCACHELVGQECLFSAAAMRLLLHPPLPPTVPVTTLFLSSPVCASCFSFYSFAPFYSFASFIICNFLHSTFFCRILSVLSSSCLFFFFSPFNSHRKLRV
ncbi:unnamed protein product [Protopolystoma xenopodis]|uniref:Uncharacterized protein n=1 Tax=Protopolystoma xenopodis TaxID=117903 RepID=A0A3S5AUD9_9PLAT|nr:unnamed protein product [Protopolystoma xenopodis]